MKKMTKVLASTLVLLAVSSYAFAKDCESAKKVESYAHPTMFGSQAQETVNANAVYVTGGKILKSENKIGIKNKDNVLVESWVKDVLALIKDQQPFANGQVFNPKMPVLRSELAVILAEGFNLNNKAVKKSYSDINSEYWAKDWIYGATNAGVMIGYPDNKFRPDQPITKAEVFATIAQLINVPIDRSLIVPPFKGKDIQYIPRWAVTPTKEVVASKLLDQVPNPSKVSDDEYLSKEQVAYLVGALRQDWAYKNSLAKDPNAPDAIKAYTPTVLNIKLADRLSARQSNVGDKFTAKTTKDVTIAGTCFKAGSLVKGEVVEVSRPGVKNPGYIKVKFLSIKDGDNCAKFPKNISQAQADVMKNPNFIARLFGFPFSGSARVVGVAVRTVGSAVNVAGNGAEQFGDNLSNVFVDTMSLQPVAGVKNVGNAVVTLGKGIFDLCKLAVSGTFGVLYEVTDEVRYLIVPAYSNSSSLNPGEELNIIF